MSVSISLSRCAVHTQTNKPWTLAQCIDAYASAGFGGVSVWRDVIEPIGVAEAARIIRASGLAVPSLVRGGFLVAREAADRQKALDVNRVCIDEAHGIGAQMLVLVVGAVVGMPLDEARKHAAESIAALLPYAHQANVKLAIEPLHPMYAADRSCINRMAEARTICGALRDPMLGIALDVYHTWWDPDLKIEIERAGRNQTLFGFHVCDWKALPRTFLTDRGLMGEGCIDIRTIRSWVEGAGFTGLSEVEIFSDIYWQMDQHAYMQMITDACVRHI